MAYIMTKKTPFMYLTERYFNITKQVYKDFKIDVRCLKRSLIS